MPRSPACLAHKGTLPPRPSCRAAGQGREGALRAARGLLAAGALAACGAVAALEASAEEGRAIAEELTLGRGWGRGRPVASLKGARLSLPLPGAHCWPGRLAVCGRSAQRPARLKSGSL